MNTMAHTLARPAADRRISPLASKVRRLVSLLLVHGVLVAGAIFILMPFVWMLVTSIKPPSEVFDAGMRLWPQQFYGGENYGYALSKAPLLRFMLNGVIVCD